MIDHAMRVEDCWVGTRKSPVFLVKSDGCTAESAMLHTPSYLSFVNAISIGWLSVRQQGMTNILVGCSITLCHFCDNTCQVMTPPRVCRDDSVRDYERMWNESTDVAEACSPRPESFSNPTEIGVSSQSSKITISLTTVVLIYIPKL
uniref:ZP domain-containing protein n=1 Tax=Heterorhabditis bacteriophora TaxID=37862 RepID=A0A1I7XRN6_HETBA